MFKFSSRVLGFIVASAFVLTACDKSDDESSGSGKASALSASGSVLQYVPADTPYVFANIEPLPEELLDKLEPKLDRMMQSYQTVLREVIAQKQREMSDAERNSEDMQKMNAVADELMTLLSIQGMRDAGIGRDSTSAIYGNGLLPVIRLQLTDGALFEDALQRIEEKAEQKLPVAEVDGHSYRYFDADELKIVIAVISDQAVITMVPSVFDAEQTGAALGLTLPDTNIADSGVLQEIAEEYDFTNHFVGFFDVEAMVEPFVGTATGVNADLIAMGDHDPTDLSDVCRAEIRAMAGIAPRMVMGYNKLSLESLDSTVVFELRDDIAGAMQGLAAAVPGLGGDKGGLMSFGMSVDMKAFRSFVEAQLDSLEAEPFECEHFADIQAGVADARAALQQPVPPMIYDFKGFIAVIDEIEGLDVATQTPPTSVDGTFLLAMDNATALVSMGAMFSPDLAALNLQADGNPVALDVPQLQAMGIEAFAAMTDDAVAISMGEDAEAQIGSALTAESTSPPPFLSFSVDAARYYGFMGDAIASGQSDDTNAPSPEMQGALQEVMLGVADIYDRMSADVILTPKGIEMRSTVTLKD